VRTETDNPKVGRRSLQVFCLAIAKNGPGEEETILDLMRITQERDTTLGFWLTASKIPVRHLGAESQFVQGIHLEGPWLGEW